jgi:glycogen(starch) synthase
MLKLCQLNRKLHIVFLDFDDLRNSLLGAGQAKSTFEVGRRLVQKGHRVTVISSRFPGYTDRWEEGLYYKHIGIGSKKIRLNNIFYILSLPFTVRRLKADIILECFTAPISALMTPLWTKIPVVAKPTSFEAERFAKLYHLPFAWVERFGCRFYKYFIPANPYHEEKMRLYNPKIISNLIPEGVEDNFLQIKKGKAKHILFLGRIDISQKGIDLLLEAYAKVSDKIRWPLVIAGNGPDENKVRLLIKKYNLDNKVKMIGPTYGEKKIKAMSEALFVTIPSRHEGFCLFALEALATGLPLVTFAIPGISWTSKKATFRAKPFIVEEYAGLLRKAATDKDLIIKMGCSARQFARQFTWEKVIDNLEKFIFKILERENKKYEKK